MKLCKKHPKYKGKRKPTSKCRECLFAYQRATQGFADIDTFSLDSTIANFIVPRLKRFIEVNNGNPGDLTSDEWNNILHTILEGFKFLGSDDKYEALDKDPRWKSSQTALNLFAKYFNHLWW